MLVRARPFARAAARETLWARTASTAPAPENVFEAQRRKMGKPTMPNRVMIFANEVSVISKFNPFRQQVEVLERIWRRACPGQVKRREQEVNREGQEVQTAEQQFQTQLKALEINEDVGQAVEKAKKAPDSRAVKKVEKKLKENIKAKVKAKAPKASKKDVTGVADRAVSEIYKAYGTQNEGAAIKTYEKQTGTKVRETNSTMYRRELCAVDGVKFFVGGRIDGFSGERVVEIKNRMYAFKQSVPIYDLVQLQTYLHVLDRAEGELVERMRSGGPSGEATRRTVVKRDEAFWTNRIMPPLVSFANLFCYFVGEPRAQRRLIRAEDTAKKNQVLHDIFMEMVHHQKHLAALAKLDEAGRWLPETSTYTAPLPQSGRP